MKIELNSEDLRMVVLKQIVGNASIAMNIERENLEQRDEVFSVCLSNDLELYCCANKYQSVRITGGVFFTINWKPDAKAEKLDYSQFMYKYGKLKMKQSIEKAMTELKMGREELSCMLGFSRQYITKMLTRPQSEKTQNKVIGMIDDLVKNKNMMSMSCLEIKGVSIDERDKVIKELNQALEYKDQLLARNEDDLHKQANRANVCKENNLKLGEQIIHQRLVISRQTTERIEIEKLNSELSDKIEVLKRKNKEMDNTYMVV